MNTFLQPLFGSIFRVQCSEPLAALTFDDGPDPVYTSRLLDLLKRYDAKATFFIIGQAAQEQPDLLKRIFEDGHCIGNHGWDHTSFAGLSAKGIIDQIQKCSRTLGKYESAFFRPPFGHQTLLSTTLARILRYKIIGGDVVPMDWTHISARDIFLKIQSNLAPGSIVILHDRLFKQGPNGNPDRTQTLMALEDIFASFGQNYKFVTINELLARGRPEIRVWTHAP